MYKMKIDKRALGVSGLMVLGTIFVTSLFAWVLHYTPMWLNAVIAIGGLWFFMYMIAKD